MRIGIGTSIVGQQIVGGGVQYLDEVGGTPTAAYSVDKVVSTYTDAVVRVRRASDNEEADVAFDNDTITLDSAVDNFSTGSLSATLGEFVANASYSDPDSLGSPDDAFVATWYDQAGSNDATQVTGNDQPKIVSSGALVTENGRVAVSFDGNDFVRSASVSISQPLTQIAVATLGFGLANDNNDYRMTWNSVNAVALYKDDAGDPDTFNMFAGNVVSGIIANEDQNLWFGVFSNVSSETHINNSLAMDGTAGNNSMSDFIIGSELNGVKGWNGTIQEIIIYNSDKSALRTAIEANINGRFNIYT